MSIVVLVSVLLFGYFDPENVFDIMKINKFRGDLTDMSEIVTYRMPTKH